MRIGSAVTKITQQRIRKLFLIQQMTENSRNEKKDTGSTLLKSYYIISNLLGIDRIMNEKMSKRRIQLSLGYQQELYLGDHMITNFQMQLSKDKRRRERIIGQKLPQDAINPAHGSLLMVNSPGHEILFLFCVSGRRDHYYIITILGRDQHEYKNNYEIDENYWLFPNCVSMLFFDGLSVNLSHVK